MNFLMKINLSVSRARRVQRFLSQPFTVAEQFTGLPGVMVPIEETIRGFNAILNGDVDDLPEQAFLNVGTIDDAIAKGKKLLEAAQELILMRMSGHPTYTLYMRMLKLKIISPEKVVYYGDVEKV
jgi:hypothetical protein